MTDTRQPIVDTHVHLWDFKYERLKWIWLERDFIHPILGNIDAMKAVSYQIDDLWAEARFAGIESFVHVQAAIGSEDPVEETRWLTAMRANSPVPFTIIADATLGVDTAAATIDGHAESPYFVGVRDFTAEPMLAAGEINPTYEASLRMLAEREIVFDLDCEWMNMPAARALAELGLDQVQRLLAGEDLARAGAGVAAVQGLGQAVIEVADRRLQRLGQLPQAGGGDAVGTTLVLLDLLEADADVIPRSQRR